MNIDKPYVLASFLVGLPMKEVSHFFPANDVLDRTIVETLNHLQDIGLAVSQVNIGSTVTISCAAIETISTLSEEQAVGWISVLRKAAND